MTRRLALAAVAFTCALLLGAVLPLGLATARRDRADYGEGTRQAARTIATLAEDRFDEDGNGLSVQRLATAGGPETGVLVLGAAGNVLVKSGLAMRPPPETLADARAGRTRSATSGGVDFATAPIAPDNQLRGSVVIGRSLEPVDHRIGRLWAVLAVIAGAALAASVGLAYAAARWVTRPLHALEATAQRWADGRLGQRADVGAAPPEVRDVAHALNAMAARLDTLVDGSRAVVADVSHQLRTPLAAVRLRLELLRADADATAATDLADTLAEVDRLSRMVDGMLAVARAENVDTVPEPVDVAALSDERCQAWRPVAAERSVTLTVQPDGAAAVASVTPGHLEQVLDNLIANALDAVDDAGSVTIRTRRDGDRVEVAVADDGRGMTEEQQAIAFRRFGTASPTGGTGLGLAIVHRLVTADGGEVRLHSRPGEGTTVTVVLPATAAARHR